MEKFYLSVVSREKEYVESFVIKELKTNLTTMLRFSLLLFFTFAIYKSFLFDQKKEHVY